MADSILSGCLQYTEPALALEDASIYNFNPVGCTSEETKPTTDLFCQNFCNNSGTTYTNGYYLWDCPGTLHTSDPGKPGQKLGYDARPLYLIHNGDELRGDPSNVSTIVPSVVVPVVVLIMAIVGVLLLLRRRRRRKRWHGTNAKPYGMKDDQDLKDASSSGPADLELDDMARFELGQSVRPPRAELDMDQEIGEARDTSQRAELEDTVRQELSSFMPASHEVREAVQPYSDSRRDQTAAGAYDSEPFERYQSIADEDNDVRPIQPTYSGDRLRTLQEEECQLDKESRHL